MQNGGFVNKIQGVRLSVAKIHRHVFENPGFKTMKDRKITSYRLEKMGFSRATYYSIQKGNSVSTNTINQLCKLLKCDVSDVIQYIDEEE